MMGDGQTETPTAMGKVVPEADVMSKYIRVASPDTHIETSLQTVPFGSR